MAEEAERAAANRPVMVGRLADEEIFGACWACGGPAVYACGPRWLFEACSWALAEAGGAP